MIALPFMDKATLTTKFAYIFAHKKTVYRIYPKSDYDEIKLAELQFGIEDDAMHDLNYDLSDKNDLNYDSKYSSSSEGIRKSILSS
jgi:hypothetical protein